MAEWRAPAMSASPTNGQLQAITRVSRGWFGYVDCDNGRCLVVPVISAGDATGPSAGSRVMLVLRRVLSGEENQLTYGWVAVLG